MNDQDKNKLELINYIKELRLDKRIENFLENHIYESEMNQDLLNRVASVVELCADEDKMKAKLYETEASILEEYKNSMEGIDSMRQEEVEKLLKEFMTKVENSLNEASRPSENTNQSSPTTA